MEKNVNYSAKSKIATKIISMFLTLLIIFFAIPSIVYVEAAEAIENLGNGDEETLSENIDSPAKNIGEIYEAKELREENVKHFRLEDGSYVAAVYPGAVHISDGDGGWQDIDNSLHDISGEIGTLDGKIKLSKKITKSL